MRKGMGWRPPRPDFRDYTRDHPKITALLNAPKAVATPPAAVDLRQWCSPVTDQGQLGCHDAATDVLTEVGWVPWPEYDGHTRLATVHQDTHQLEYQAPLAVQRWHYRGPMYQDMNRCLSFLVTPNHRMFVRPCTGSRTQGVPYHLAPEYSFIEIQDIGWWSGLLPAPSGWAGEHQTIVKIGSCAIDGDDFFAFLGLMVSDGWVAGPLTPKSRRFGFCCFNRARQSMIRALAARLPFQMKEQRSRPGVWYAMHPDLHHWLNAECYGPGPSTGSVRRRGLLKKIPDLVRRASMSQIEIFLHYFGDQHVRQGFRHFYNSAPLVVDGLQELILKTGRRVTVHQNRQRELGFTKIRGKGLKFAAQSYTIVEWKGRPLSITRRQQIRVEPYDGMAYCATVPNGLLITRRDGTVLISGNSCTAHAAVGLYEYWEKRAAGRYVSASRRFLYKATRDLAGDVGDTGADLRTTMQALVVFGTPPEQYWPYDVAAFDVEPGPFCYAFGQAYQALSYYRLDTPAGTAGGAILAAARAQIAAGHPPMFGWTCYSSLDSATDGFVPLPLKGEQVTGGHACIAVGFDDAKVCPNATPGALLFKNSWGTGWGQAGYGFLPYDYLRMGLTADWWCMVKGEWLSPVPFTG